MAALRNSAYAPRGSTWPSTHMPLPYKAERAGKSKFDAHDIEQYLHSWHILIHALYLLFFFFSLFSFFFSRSPPPSPRLPCDRFNPLALAGLGS